MNTGSPDAASANPLYQLKNKRPGWHLFSYTAKNGVTLPCQFYRPANFTMQHNYPVLFFMHGMGSVGTDGEHIRKPEITSVLSGLVGSPEYRNSLVILAPQTTREKPWVKVKIPALEGTYRQEEEPVDSLAAAKELFDLALASFPLDSRRVYGWGNSMGAYALWDLATRYPDFFTAFVAVAGGGDPEKAAVIAHIPVRAYHGDADKVVHYDGSRKMIEAMKAAGARDAELITYEGVGHHASLCFGAAGRDTAAVDWLFAQRK
ncbi:MAG: dienelactone hydrolase family protein [Clostridia bacterium]|nr:dienelactone hydrolase family protein [Clostridia bacterium]